VDSPEEIAQILVPTICDRFDSKSRLIIALAGPPGAGKSTLAEALVKALNEVLPDHPAEAVPMDGFHYDNRLLDEGGLRAKKGAPETFDASGFLALLHRLRAPAEPVAIPVFDRTIDLSRASARMIHPKHLILVVEGNYLLLNRPTWRDLKSYFDLSIMLKPSLEIIEERLIQRWLDNGYDRDGALAKARGNDLANARIVLAESSTADIERADN
jgi:pantothenate kinase